MAFTKFRKRKISPIQGKKGSTGKGVMMTLGTQLGIAAALAASKIPSLRQARQDPWGAADSALHKAMVGLDGITKLVPEQHRQDPSLTRAMSKIQEGIRDARDFVRSKQLATGSLSAKPSDKATSSNAGRRSETTPAGTV